MRQGRRLAHPGAVRASCELPALEPIDPNEVAKAGVPLGRAG
jgi:hypothetical protein